MDSFPIRVEIDSKQKYYDFVADHYLRKFSTVPDKCDLLIAATKGPEVVGTIALNFGLTQHAGFHEVFDVAPESKHLLRKKHVELGRWISTLAKPKVSEILLHAAVLVAAQKRCELVFVQQRLALERVLKQAGIAVNRVDATPNLAKVSSNDLPFYLQQRPVLNCFKVEQAIAALESRVDRLIDSGLVEFVDIHRQNVEVEI